MNSFMSLCSDISHKPGQNISILAIKKQITFCRASDLLNYGLFKVLWCHIEQHIDAKTTVVPWSQLLMQMWECFYYRLMITQKYEQWNGQAQTPTYTQ